MDVFFLGAASVCGWLIGWGSGDRRCLFFVGSIPLVPLPHAVTLQFLTVPPFAAVIAVCMVAEP